jgi:hypothetical protein
MASPTLSLNGNTSEAYLAAHHFHPSCSVVSSSPSLTAPSVPTPRWQDVLAARVLRWGMFLSLAILGLRMFELHTAEIAYNPWPYLIALADIWISLYVFRAIGQGEKWARVVLVVFFGLHLLFQLKSLGTALRTREQDPWHLVGSLVYFATQAAAFGLLFVNRPEPVRGPTPQEQLESLLQDAQTLGLREQDALNAADMLEYSEPVLGFDIIVQQLYEYDIEITPAFYQQIVQTGQALQLDESAYAFTEKLVQSATQVPEAVKRRVADIVGALLNRE